MKRRANYPAAGKAEIALRLAIDDHWLGLPEPGCWAAIAHNTKNI
jgi:hypothetical protein